MDIELRFDDCGLHIRIRRPLRTEVLVRGVFLRNAADKCAVMFLVNAGYARHGRGLLVVACLLVEVRHDLRRFRWVKHTSRVLLQLLILDQRSNRIVRVHVHREHFTILAQAPEHVALELVIVDLLDDDGIV